MPRYTLSCPPYFGNAINTTDDNPLTVEGIGNLRLSGEEKAALLAFLQMLTDSVFITDPRFSDPFAIATPKNKKNE